MANKPFEIGLVGAAALTAGYLGSDQPPVRSPEEAVGLAGRNKLYDSWVDRIDIQDLLRDRDLGDDQRPVISLLDSTVLKEIADQGLASCPGPSDGPTWRTPSNSC